MKIKRGITEEISAMPRFLLYGRLRIFIASNICWF